MKDDIFPNDIYKGRDIHISKAFTEEFRKRYRNNHAQLSFTNSSFGPYFPFKLFSQGYLGGTVG